MKIRIKYIRDIDIIEPFPNGNWIDLRCAEETHLKKGEYKQIPLGIAVELPQGFEALIAPRSSTFRRYKILSANSLGIIDSSYCGDDDEWCFPAYATDDTVIPKNDRIAQFRIMYRMPSCDIVVVDTLGNVSRGGLGSTGRT